jgi:TP901 family phage tail tape measure protein
MATEIVGRGLVEILPDFRKFGPELMASMRVARSQLDGSARGLRAAAGTVVPAMAKIGKGVSLVGVGIAAASIKMAGDFQAETAVLQTAAGETAGGLKIVRSGIMDISKGTGTGMKNLTDGMYTIEKAGFRGAGGLTVLKAAAQGAREENANLADVTNAMTSVMASYHLKTTDSVRVMNALKTSAGEGKITMEEFSGALSTVLPIASANKISFEEVGGAIATLTQHGTSAREATQELAATIRQLAAPNMVAQREMSRFGLSATDVSQNLGKRGLTGTFELLTGTILKKMGPSGKILMSAFEGTKQSAKDAQIMLSKMPPEISKVAKEYIGGKMSLEDWNNAMKGTPVGQQPMLRNFKTLVDRSKGFSRELKSGGPDAKTYTDALKKMSGGAIGLNTILQLTGESLPGFKDRVKKTGESFHNASKDVEGWKVTQDLFNVKLDRFKMTLQVLAIQIGTKLLPIVGGFFAFFANNQGVFLALAASIGALLGVFAAAYVAMKLYRVYTALATAATWLFSRANGASRAQMLLLRVQMTLMWVQQKLVVAASGIATAAQWLWNTSIFGTTASMIALKVQLGALFLWQKIQAAGTGIATAAQWAWNLAMEANPIGLVILAVGLLVGAILYIAGRTTWFQTAWKYTWNAIKVAAEWVWHALQAVWSGIVTGFNSVIGAAQAVWNWIKSNWPYLVGAIAGPFGVAVVYVIRHWTQVKDFLKSIWDMIYRNVVAPIIRFFAHTIPDSAVAMKNGMVGAFRTTLMFVLDVFGNIIKGAAKLFGWVPGIGGQLRGAARQFQNFRDTVNKALGGVSGHTVSVPVSFRTVGGTKVFTRAQGGAIDGVGTETSDSNLVLMSKGEHVWTAKEVKRAGGHQAVMGLRKAAKEGKLPAFANGGTLGAHFTGIPSYKTVSSAMGKAVRAEIDANKKGLFNLLPQAMAASASGFIGGGKAPSGGANHWRSVVVQMLNMVGQSTGLVNTVLRRMQQESGGNPNIVNKWDSNWKAGHPSVGLMQVIGPTFRAYAGKYLHTGPFLYGTSVNPQANIYSSFKYALSRYGSLSNAFNRAGGYDNGGWLPKGLSLAYNGTGAPERIRNQQQEASLGGGGGLTVVVNVGTALANKNDISDAVVAGIETARRRGYVLPKSVVPRGA